MRLLTLLVLCATPLGHAGDAPPAAPAAPATPATPAAPARPPREDFGTATRAVAPSGVTFSVVLRDEYIAGFPILVEVTASNETSEPKVTPDLDARHHLVHFKLTDSRGRESERYNTPPQFDTGGDWTLAPKARRSVLLEIPSSPGFAIGDWKLNVLIGDGAQAVVLPEHRFRVMPARPTGGDLAWEPVVARNSGALVPWVHGAKGGHDVYLNQYAPNDAGRLLAHHWLFRSSKPLSPMMSRTAASTARSRWLYWVGEPGELRVARLEGQRIAGGVRSLGIPWASAVPLARGVSDGKGGFALPLWVPKPKGPAGEVRFLVMSERGEVSTRDVALYAEKPPLVETGLDAGGNAVLVLGHDKGIDIFRLDPARDVRLPALGDRAWKSADGWKTAGLAFDVLPDKDGRAGGLAIVAAQVLPAVDKVPAQVRALHFDLAGKLFSTGPATPWQGPAQLTSLIPAGYGPFHYVGKDAQGQTVFGASDAAPTPMGKLPDASAWQDAKGAWSLRWLAGERIVSERAVPAPGSPNP